MVYVNLRLLYLLIQASCTKLVLTSVQSCWQKSLSLQQLSHRDKYEAEMPSADFSFFWSMGAAMPRYTSSTGRCVCVCFHTYDVP